MWVAPLSKKLRIFGRSSEKGFWTRRSLTTAAILLGVAGLVATPATSDDKQASPSIPFTIPEMMKHMGFEPSLEQAMREGTILTTSMPEMENTERELALSAVMLVVRRPLDAVVDVYMDDEVFRLHSDLVDWKEIGGGLANPQALRADFEELAYSSGEQAEVRKLLKVKPGSTVVFFTNRIFTDQIAGFASGMKRNVGRGRIEKAVAGYFGKLRTILERESRVD